MKQDHKQPVIFGLIIFILVIINLWQLFFIPYEYNTSRAALKQAYTNIYELVIFILIGGLYTALVAWIMGWRKDMAWERHRDVYYKFLNKDELKELKKEKEEAVERVAKLEAECERLNAHIKGRIEYDVKVIADETKN